MQTSFCPRLNSLPFARINYGAHQHRPGDALEYCEIAESSVFFIYRAFPLELFGALLRNSSQMFERHLWRNEFLPRYSPV